MAGQGSRMTGRMVSASVVYPSTTSGIVWEKAGTGWQVEWEKAGTGWQVEWEKAGIKFHGNAVRLKPPHPRQRSTRSTPTRRHLRYLWHKLLQLNVSPSSRPTTAHAAAMRPPFSTLAPPPTRAPCCTAPSPLVGSGSSPTHAWERRDETTNPGGSFCWSHHPLLPLTRHLNPVSRSPHATPPPLPTPCRTASLSFSRRSPAPESRFPLSPCTPTTTPHPAAQPPCPFPAFPRHLNPVSRSPHATPPHSHTLPHNLARRTPAASEER
eukprot:366549-Chlamydomonas_euryale.AAC.11